MGLTFNVLKIFSWFFLAEQNVWAVFILVIMFSKYGEIRMGHGPPEFRDITWFAMILSCSVGTGVFIYGLQEPLEYYTHSNK